jgi:hypothetical protein
MTEFSMGCRPVPSISLPPLIAKTLPAIFAFPVSAFYVWNRMPLHGVAVSIFLEQWRSVTDRHRARCCGAQRYQAATRGLN